MSTFTMMSVLGIAMFYAPSIHAQGCDKGWFGSSCQYKCHCDNNNCDNNGDCMFVDTCVKGWFGPQCQYVDLGYTENDGTTNEMFRDADDTTCSDNPNQQTATMVFNRTFPFTWLRLYVKNKDMLQNIDVTFTDGSGNSNIPCNNMESAVVDSNTIDIHCDVSVEVQKVMVTGEAVGYLCSFYVSGGRNVALKQSTSQSSTLHGGLNFHAFKAVDGNTDQDVNNGSCSHTESYDIEASWKVTFSRTSHLNRYVIYNREGCCQERLKGFVLSAYDKGSVPVFTYKDTQPNPLSVYTVTSMINSSSVRSVTIKATNPVQGMPPILTLCEVEIYGDSVCQVGTYGRECEHTCHCASNKPCFVSTGRCPNGCAAGYTGEHCERPCSDTYFGIDCKQACGINCANQKCNSVNGKCAECTPGFIGGFCDQECPDTTYGQQCTLECGTTCVERLCDSETGRCDQCPAGKTGDQCDKNCPANQYGPRCVNVCSTNCLNQLCNVTDGRCYQCPSGRRGDYCDQVCSSGTYGEKCQESCNENCEGCDPVNGSCSSGCIAGYTGILCDKVCEYGKYGKDCSNDCSEFCNKNGTRDNESSCHHVSGSCHYGCVEDYIDTKCVAKLSAETSDSEPGLGVGLGIGLGVAALVVIVVVGIYCYRRKLSAERARRQRPPGYDAAEPTTEEHGYNELFKTDDGYHMPTDEATSTVTVKSPSKDPAETTVQYVNADVTTYEDIDQVAIPVQLDNSTKSGHEYEGYVNY